MNDFGLLVGRYLESLPTMTNQQVAELLLDASGRLIISGRYLEDSAHSSGDAGLSILAVRNDTPGSLVDADGDYAPLQVDEDGNLRVSGELSVVEEDTYEEDSPHTSGDKGTFILSVRQDTLASSTSADGDYAALKVNELGELYVKDSDSLTKLTEIDTVLDDIYVDTQAMVVDLAAIETELLDQGGTLDDIDSSLDSIETDIGSLTHEEDTAHVSGDKGVMPLAVRADADGSLVNADGDYAPLQVNSEGKLKVAGEFSEALEGSEEYSATDGLVVGEDGLETITAAGTPWITVASLAINAGEQALVYGWDWSCDQNANARLITDDGEDVVVYKHALNSSAVPSYESHWSKEGRIEIAGAEDLVLKLQIKKRQVPGGNASGFGAIHARKI